MYYFIYWQYILSIRFIYLSCILRPQFKVHLYNYQLNGCCYNNIYFCYCKKNDYNRLFSFISVLNQRVEIYSF